MADVEDEGDIKIIKKIPKIGTELRRQTIQGKQSYKKPPPRYNDGSLVNMMKPEKLNIGRPATTQSIITKIQERDYVAKGDIEGVEKEVITLELSDSVVKTIKDKIMYGKEINKFYPTKLGITVTEFLVENFSELMDYKFTSDMEEKLDDIAEGKTKWLKVMKAFYKQFHPKIDEISKTVKEFIKQNKKVLGVHPETGEEITMSLGRFGYQVQMKKNKKIVRAPVREPLTPENITLEDAIKLLIYPKSIGEYEGKEIVLQTGQHGQYLKYNKENISVGTITDITLEEAIKRIKERNARYLWTGSKGTYTYQVLEGPYGTYIAATNSKTKKRVNVKLPKDIKIEDLTADIVSDIVANWKPRRKFKRAAK